MRADRLVALLLLLQRRDLVTAAEVAVELEVSERTARRDLEALGTAGLPVYATAGRGGGWRLLGGGRTDLSGLSRDEIRALFLGAGPQDASPQVRAALRKLVRALPEAMRDDAESAQRALVIDPVAWGGRSAAFPKAPPCLADIQTAVVTARQVELHYVDRVGADTTRTVAPLGLAAKGARWYLVADTDAGRRTFRVDRVRAVRLLDEPVVRPDDFDLTTAWSEVADRIETLRHPVTARAHLRHDLIALASWLFGTRFVLGGPVDDIWVEVEIRGPGVLGLAGELAGFGGGLVVQEPLELRERLGEIGHELARTYAS